MSSPTLTRVRSFLTENGIFVKSSPEVKKKKALIECWKVDKCPLMGGIKDDTIAGSKNSAIDKMTAEEEQVSRRKRASTAQKECRRSEK